MTERSKDRFYWAIIILLIIIILILLFFNRIGKVVDKNPSPTGNIDVFDIDISCGCNDKDSCQNPVHIDKKGNVIPVFDDVNSDNNKEDNNKDDNTIPTFDEEEDKEFIGTIFVDDVNGNYIYQQNLKIFTNSAFEQEDMIAPGVSNTYNFIVHNSSNVNLKYNILMYDVSDYNVNLKFRLRRNNKYVVGSDSKWVSVSELKKDDLFIEEGSSDSYSLDWKWPYNDGKDNEDTIAGENMTSKYKLNIRFDFRQV